MTTQNDAVGFYRRGVAVLNPSPSFIPTPVWVLAYRKTVLWQHFKPKRKQRRLSLGYMCEQLFRSFPHSVSFISRYSLLRVRERWTLEGTDSELEAEIRWVLAHGTWTHQEERSFCTFGARVVVVAIDLERQRMGVVTVQNTADGSPAYIQQFFRRRAIKRGKR